MLMNSLTSVKRLCGRKFDAYELDWDTQYFEIPSAKVILSGSVLEEERVLLKGFIKCFEFVTISNLGNNPLNNRWIGRETGAFQTDMNVQFVKDLNYSSVTHDNTACVYEAHSYDEGVMEVARTSFKYSRFFNDPMLPVEKARNIYAHWAEGAFGKPGRYYCISERQGRVAGFLLFSIDSETLAATIELIAVDELFRGSKVGKELIAGMETLLFEKRIKSIRVGTQIDNTMAIRFYTQCGFKYTGCNSVFHLWNK